MPVMPNVVGVDFIQAQGLLTQAGLVINVPIGSFSNPSMRTIWQKSVAFDWLTDSVVVLTDSIAYKTDSSGGPIPPPEIVLSQSIPAGTQMLPQAPFTLFISQPPMGVVSP